MRQTGEFRFSAEIDWRSITLSSNNTENPDIEGRKTILLNFCQRRYRTVNKKKCKDLSCGIQWKKTTSQSLDLFDKMSLYPYKDFEFSKKYSESKFRKEMSNRKKKLLGGGKGVREAGKRT